MRLMQEQDQRVNMRHSTGARARVFCALLAELLLLSCGNDVVAPENKWSTRQRENAACLDRAVFGNPAESPYVLPFPVGAAYRVSASYCDASDPGHYNEIAYDFVMPVGGDIVASRSGTVVEVVDHFEDGTNDNTRSNYIAIRHNDGTVAGYGHTQQQGALVRVGDQVAQGQQIGHSGSSGAGGLPHLHIGIFRAVVWRRTDDVAFNFRNAEGPLDQRGGLLEGATYTALPY
jgi:murein DD-endopeptidase MepM/ murein hydrolase activator NlpD